MDDIDKEKRRQVLEDELKDLLLSRHIDETSLAEIRRDIKRRTVRINELTAELDQTYGWPE